MLVSQKCRYAVRAIFELSRRHGTGFVKIADIAREQAIPIRFLEVILNQLKHTGYVRSQRGVEGGYTLTRDPAELPVGEIIKAIQGPVEVVDCESPACTERCPLYENCVFLPLWKRVESAILDIYCTTTFQDLLNRDRSRQVTLASDYMI